MTRKLTALMAVAITGLLAACAGGSGAPVAPPRGDASEGRVDLTFWAWAPGVDKAVSLWNSEHPDVQVKLTKIPTGSGGGYARMYSALKAGSGAPDLAQVEYQEIPGFLLAQGLVDLRPYGTDRDKGLFVDWQWQQGVFGDGVYAIPQASGPMAFYYRGDLFATWGITPPKTWQEFRTAARTIRQKDPKAYISTFPPGNSAWFTALAWQAGASWFGVSDNAWTVNIDSPETRRVADYWDSMVRDGLVKTEPDFSGDWYKDLRDGSVVGWVSAQWGGAILSGNAPGTSGVWRVAPMPQWEGTSFASANWGGSSTVVLTGCAHPRQAERFAVWLNSDARSIDLLIAGGYGWPAAKGAFVGSSLDKPDLFFGGQRTNAIFAEADASIDRNWTWIPTMAATYRHLDDGFRRAIEGNGSFADAVAASQRETEADLRAKGLQVAAP